ncbi:phage antirepressor Ant [Leucobacter viscericola]|uniref:Phage antirepressor Ant n=1 Tax=Leucobacter viscericola TaxID=2714935 RepID=A0A6G7XIB2_9MICO|nr:phage antirepressor KilAC domain-containing protein [Leucobacter viscericola]QIK64111.1 phage antirepressor Ant [Leucobacter viscericola]
MNAVETFNFEGWDVRHVVIDGETWFVARDIAQVLGYADVANAIKQHCKGVAKHHPLQTKGGVQQARVIGEADVMRLIVSSKLPAAVQFERWLFEKVLPEIRRTGSYGVQHQVPQSFAEALALAARVEAERAELEAKVVEDAPKVLFADSVAASKSTILVGELAKILRGNGVDIGQNRLFEVLRDEGYLIRRAGSDRNMPTQYAMELGLFEIKETAVTHSDGHVTISKTPKVTGKGQQYFVNRYAEKAVA